MTKKNLNSTSNEDLLSAFIKENNKNGIRVFVAGGSREGNNPLYIRETYNLGRKIVEMGFKLDFGLSNRCVVCVIGVIVLICNSLVEYFFYMLIYLI